MDDVARRLDCDVTRILAMCVLRDAAGSSRSLIDMGVRRRTPILSARSFACSAGMALLLAAGAPASAIDLKSLVVPPRPVHGGAAPDPNCAAPPSDSTPVPAAAVTFQARDHDRACLVSLAEAEKIRLKTNGQFVDVRSPVDYDRLRIADSINIPLHLVKTKPFLRKLNVVLVDHGRSSAELEHHCRQLRTAGFHGVSVLDGGLHAWQHAGRPLAGDAAAQSRLNRMSAAELFAERQYTGWLVVDLSAKGVSRELRKWLPANTVTVKPKAASDAAAAVRALINRERKANPRLNVLVAADADDRYERLARALAKAGDGPVLYLEGGFTAYRRFVDSQVAIWDQQSQPPRFPSCRG